MIYVTHDQVEAMTLADRMVILNAGAIEQAGTPLDLFNSPANKFVAGFLGQPPMNFIRVTGAKHEGGRFIFELPGGKTLELAGEPDSLKDLADLELGIRPEDVSISKTGDGLPVEIDVVEHLGDETILHGYFAGGQSITARLAGQSSFKAGQQLWLEMAPERLLVFDRTGRQIGMAGE
jgi:ABC-type sugar transport system ATPase subunit